MYLMKLKFPNGDEIEFLTEKNNVEENIENNLQYNDLPEFYEDQKEFINKCVFSVEEAKLGIYYVSSDKSGYDTYYDGVFYGYSKQDALNNAKEKSDNFSEPVELLGYSLKENPSSPEICVSFHNG